MRINIQIYVKMLFFEEKCQNICVIKNTFVLLQRY